MDKNFVNHIKKGISYSVVGSLGLVVLTALTGCEEKKPEENKQVFTDVNKAQNTMFVIEEKPKGSYKVIEQFPTTGPTRAIIRDENGTERVMQEDELKKLAQQEAEKVNNGTSNLTSATPPAGGLSLGEALLAGAAGGILGSLVGSAIANKMMNNDKFQQAQRQANYNQPSIQRGVTPTGGMAPSPQATTNNQPKSGFFGGNNTPNTPATTTPSNSNSFNKPTSTPTTSSSSSLFNKSSNTPTSSSSSSSSSFNKSSGSSSSSSSQSSSGSFGG